MNLSVRFTALFTIYVTGILAIASISVYLFFIQYAKEDHFSQLRSEAVRISGLMQNKNVSERRELIQQLLEKSTFGFSKEQWSLFDSAGQVIHTNSITAVHAMDENMQSRILKASAYELTYQTPEGDDNLTIYIPETNEYLQVIAPDNIGALKSGHLQSVLFFVFIGGMLLTLLVSILFVSQSLEPLVSLSSQMQRTTELNLTERIDEGKGNTGINLIARHYNAMMQRLNSAFESQKSFVHHASHELRTPLATMLSQTEAALRKDLNAAEYKQLLLSLKEDQSGLIDLTNSLLLLSQYEKIQTARKWPLARIDEVVFDSISDAKKMLTGIDIRLQFNIKPDQENLLFIHANEALLKVAISNLLKNAWQYSADKHVVVSIEVKPANLICIHVDNQGKPIEDLEVEKLKIPFFRGSNSASIKGFGLGLSIVQRVVLLHHGFLDYSRHKPSTNRFTISFQSGT